MSVMNIFKSNEIIQVIDETTFIWEPAKIVGVISDWSVKVKWVNWTSKPATVITIPQEVRRSGRETWNIRKFEKEGATSTSTSRSRRSASSIPGNARPFSGNAAMLPRNESVCFTTLIKHCFKMKL